MKRLGVFLTFHGTCEEALNYYREIFNGRIVSMIRYDKTSEQIAEAYKKKILRAVFQAEGIQFAAGDSAPHHPVVAGSLVSLSLEITDENEQKNLFARLASSGRIITPLQQMNDGAILGTVIDKYGVHWMLHHAP